MQIKQRIYKMKTHTVIKCNYVIVLIAKLLELQTFKRKVHV